MDSPLSHGQKQHIGHDPRLRCCVAVSPVGGDDVQQHVGQHVHVDWNGPLGDADQHRAQRVGVSVATQEPADRAGIVDVAIIDLADPELGELGQLDWTKQVSQTDRHRCARSAG
ncbi:MAG: hypothetical protein ABGZ36_10910 [Actinomycetota bacterium]